MVVVEHGGRLLQTYINSSFAVRAELALQLISLMKRLWVTVAYTLANEGEFGTFS